MRVKTKPGFVDINKKLFGRYPVKFPINEPLIAIHGTNGTGKTKTLEALKEYFEEQGENVVYFDADRYLDLTKDQIISYSVAYNLMQDKNVFEKHRLNIDDPYLEMYIGQRIRSGMIQMINFICTIVAAPENCVVLIDTPESNLDMYKKREFVDIIKGIDNVKKLILVTHHPEIIGEMSWKNQIVDIKDCVNIGG